MKPIRSVFFVSDSTGITAEMLGQALLSHFDGVEFKREAMPFVDSRDKIQSAVKLIDQAGARDRTRPIIFSTLVDDDLREQLRSADALVLDCFEMFVSPLESELDVQASNAIGRGHGAGNVKDYDRRMEAVNYTLLHDDGVSEKDLAKADIILLGVSRTGKTPTCLYLALQFGIKAANYPLIPEDLSAMKLPAALKQHQRRLFGLTIRPERLQQVRAERKPNSTYASLANCKFEVRAAEALLRAESIPFFESTNKSVEELATTIVHQAHLQRHIY